MNFLLDTNVISEWYFFTRAWQPRPYTVELL